MRKRRMRGGVVSETLRMTVGGRVGALWIGGLEPYMDEAFLQVTITILGRGNLAILILRVILIISTILLVVMMQHTFITLLITITIIGTFSS